MPSETPRVSDLSALLRGCPGTSAPLSRLSGWVLACLFSFESRAENFFGCYHHGVIAGLIGLAAYFGLQPARSLTRDHSGQAVSTFTPGTMLFYAIREFYVPNVTGWIFFAAAILGIAIPGLLNRGPPSQTPALPQRCCWPRFCWPTWPFTMYSTLLSMFPSRFALASSSFRSAPRGGKFPNPRGGCNCASFGRSCSFWVSRTLKFRESAFPNLRAELAEIWRSMPPQANRVFIPVTFWNWRLRKMTSSPPCPTARHPLSSQRAAPGSLRKVRGGADAEGDLLIFDRMDGLPSPYDSL